VRLWIVATGYGLWLCSLVIVFWLMHGGDEEALQVVVIAGALPLSLQLLVLGLDPSGLVAPAKFSIALLFVILLSYLGHTEDWTPLVYLCNVAFVLATAILVAGSPDRRLLDRIAVVFSVSTGAFLLYVDLTGEYLWGRLIAHGIQPNYWGTIGLAVAVAALASRRFPVRAFGVTAGLLTIYYASARGSFIGFSAAGLTALIGLVLGLKSTRLVAVVSGMAAMLFTAIAIQPNLFEAVETVMSDVLKLDDPYRGTGTGFTGRDRLWDEAFEAWTTSPFFGVGYHQHIKVMSAIGAHNAYLALLVDTGVVGVLLYCALLVWAFVAALSIREQEVRRFIIAMIAGYAVYGLFEARAFNVGNPFSLLFLMCCFYAMAHGQRRRAHRSLRLPADNQPETRLPHPDMALDGG
jgi:O-antigen ligase